MLTLKVDGRKIDVLLLGLRNDFYLHQKKLRTLVRAGAERGRGGCPVQKVCRASASQGEPGLIFVTVRLFHQPSEGRRCAPPADSRD